MGTPPHHIRDPKHFRIARRSCILKVIAAAGGAFLALANAAGNLEKYLYFPGWAWIVFGTYVAGMWAYEMFCIGDPPK